MQRRLAFAVITALFSLASIAVVGELVARSAGRTPWRAGLETDAWSTPHPVLGWINRAGTNLSNEAGNVPMTFWDGGRRRSREHPTPPAAATRQAVLVGGSWTQGYGVRDEQTFAWKAGELLPDWHFENFGTGGYGTLQSAMSAELGIDEGRIEPELVVYGFATFHAMRNVQTFNWVDGLRDRSGERLIPPRAAFEGGHIVRRAPGTPLRNWPLEGVSALVRTVHESAVRQALLERETWIAPAMRRLIRDLDQHSHENNARFAVMTLFGEAELQGVQEHLRRNGIDEIDCRYPSDPYAPELRVGGTGHPNEIVHAYWAKCLSDWMRANLDAPAA